MSSESYIKRCENLNGKGRSGHQDIDGRILKWSSEHVDWTEVA
jgi:hypothetical protein